MKRTNIDFSKHELIINNEKNLITHHLKIPGKYTNSILFINTNGILVVTGDYGNWVFCREFHPSYDEKICDHYWIEKLRNSSSQDPYEFDSNIAVEEIKELLKNKELSEEEREWLQELSDEALNGEYSFIAKAMDRPCSFPSECIPNGEKTKYWLLVIFDGFEEICKRLKSQCKILEFPPIS